MTCRNTTETLDEYLTRMDRDHHLPQKRGPAVDLTFPASNSGKPVMVELVETFDDRGVPHFIRPEDT